MEESTLNIVKSIHEFLKLYMSSSWAENINQERLSLLSCRSSMSFFFYVDPKKWSKCEYPQAISIYASKKSFHSHSFKPAKV